MGPATAIKTGLAKSFQFKGRASRSEFWWFAPIGLTAAAIVTTISAQYISVEPEIIAAIVVFTVVSFPVWSAATRRLRDQGKQDKIVHLLLALPIVHLSFAQLFFSGLVSSSGIFGLLFGIYYFGGFVLVTLFNLALFAVVLIMCASASSNANNPHEVPS